MPTKSEIYEKVYGEQLYEEQNGMAPFLRKRLIKHEVNRYEVFLQLLPPKVERLLDVGCGGGHLAKTVVGRTSEYHGTDISPLPLRQAAETLAGTAGYSRTSLVRCDIDHGLPFDNGFFDAVACIAVLEHVVNPPNAIEEIHRVLKPNGVFIVEVPNIAWLPLRTGILFGRLPMTGGVYLGADWEHLHIFTKKLVIDLLTAEGFEIEKVTCSGVFADYRKWWVSLLGADVIVKCRKR